MGQINPKKFEYGVFLGNKIDGQTQVLRHPKTGVNKLWDEPIPGVDTMYKVFLNSVKLYPNKKMFGMRECINKAKDLYGEYYYKTYKEVQQEVIKFAKGVSLLNLCPEIKTKENGILKFLGIYSRNREEWLISDIASHMNSVVIVPIYDTLGDNTISFILSETQLTTIAMESINIKKLNKIRENNLHHKLQNIILFDDDNLEEIKKAKEIGYSVYTFKEILEKGETLPDDKFKYEECKRDSIAILSYTSGTTGKPKGAILTHIQIVAQIQTLSVLNIPLNSDDMYMSYLPLAHVFEREINLICIYIGATIAFYSGSPKRLMEDAGKCKPTIFIAVPRVLDKIYDGVVSKVKKSSYIVRSIFEKAYKDKLYNLRNYGIYTHPIWDRLVFKTIRKSMGDCLRGFVIGGAPLTVEITEAMKIFFSVGLVAGYGSTESGGGALISHGDDNLCCTVGGLLTSWELKLVDVPELGYTSKSVNENGIWEPKGEVYLRSVSPFKGYLNDKENTKLSVTEDGWIKTGDVGAILTWHGNALKIIDRVKSIFKLSQGEYIAPEKIEGILGKSSYCNNIFVTGLSTECYIIAIIVPHLGNIIKFLKAKKILPENDEGKEIKKYFENPELKKEIISDLERIGRANDLKGFELVKNIFIAPEEFSIENGLLTPTLKLKRKEISKKYDSIIKGLYGK
ncbi:MAG: AMP-binding protein [archaeon]|nr:AMP-binding protein [archaeon]